MTINIHNRIAATGRAIITIDGLELDWDDSTPHHLQVTTTHPDDDNPAYLYLDQHEVGHLADIFDHFCGHRLEPSTPLTTCGLEISSAPEHPGCLRITSHAPTDTERDYAYLHQGQLSDVAAVLRQFAVHLHAEAAAA